MKIVEIELEKLKNELLEMHKIAREAVRLCFIAMKGEKEIIKDISELECKSDKLDIKIHDHCAAILMRFHPLAKNFRFILSAMRMSSAYERIVDLTQEISLYSCNFKEKLFEAEPILLKMFDTIVEGYSDAKKLTNLSKLDDLIDDIYIKLLEELEVKYSGPDEVLATRHVERIGDLLCKIATRLHYAIEGKWVWIK